MDIDGDGRRDILSGSYSRMEDDMAGLFQVLYGTSNGMFRTAEVLTGTDGEPLIVPAGGKHDIEKICTRPFAIDWDGDGHLDLVVGNFAGTFYWFRGEGKGAFQPKPEAIKSGTEPLRLNGHHSDPFVIDWDGDGDLDLLSGSAAGGVHWAENMAGPGKLPDLRPFQVLIRPGRSVRYGRLLAEDGLTGPASSTRVWVADVNGDGKLDVLVGDTVTLISPAKNLSADEYQKKFAVWNKAVNKASRKLSSQADDEKANTRAREEFQKVYEQRTEFMNEERTGFVWLYLHK